jgi:hypothetical protein
MMLLSLFAAQAVQAQSTPTIAPPAVPDNLKAPAGEQPILKVEAKGVQIYTCTASATNANGFEWTLKAPEAELFDAQGVKVGKHYAGPTWEALDGSKVVGEAKQRADAPGGKGIPWLLLKAKESSGNGLLSKVTNVQRVDTVGGLAPAATDCNQTKKDNEVRVAYSANYYFYSSGGAASAPVGGAPSTGQGGTTGQSNSTSFSLFIILGLVLVVSLGGLLLRFVSSDKK